MLAVGSLEEVNCAKIQIIDRTLLLYLITEIQG